MLSVCVETVLGWYLILGDKQLSLGWGRGGPCDIALLSSSVTCLEVLS